MGSFKVAAVNAAQEKVERAAKISAALQKKDWPRVLQLDPTNSEGLRLKETATLEGHSLSVLSVAFSPDGKRIASGSSDKTLIIWPTSSLKP